MEQPPIQLPPEEERLNALLTAAHARSRHSLETARQLLTAGFPSPAFVWAVRAVEIFMKEALLAPAYLEAVGGSWEAALKKAEKLFGSGNWVPAYRELERLVGRLDPMWTDHGEDAWVHWKGRAVRWRGNIVHGRPNREGEAPAEDAQWAIDYAEQLFTKLTMRVFVSRRHPIFRVLAAFFEAAQASIGGPVTPQGVVGEDTEDHHPLPTEFE